MQVMSKIGAVSFMHHVDAETVQLSYPREVALSSEIKVQLMTPLGEQVNVPIKVKKFTSESIEITIQDRPSGIFYLKIQDGNTYVMKKIILQ